MTEHARDRLRRFAWGTAAVVVFFAAWFPANWLAGLVIPVEWPGGTLEGPAAEAWLRQWNRHWWLCYLIEFALTMALAGLEYVIRHRRAADRSPRPA